MKKSPLLIIFVTVFIDLIGFGIIIPLSPYLAREFGADALDVGLLMAIYSAMQLLFSPFWGRLSDRFGRRPIILISLFGAGLAHLMFAFSTSLSLLFVARALAGIFGANISTAMAYIADITDERNRSKGMGLIGAAFGLGFVLGPAVGAYFGKLGMELGSAPPFGQSLAAVVASGICLLNFVGAFKFLPESLAKEVRSSLPKRESRWKLLSQFVRRPVTGRLMFMFFLSTLAMANMEASLFLLVKDDFGWTLAQAGMGFAYVGLIMVFTQGYLVRKLMPKFGERTVLFLGLAIGAAGFFGIGIASSIPVLAVAVTLLGIGNGLTHPASTGSISLLSGQSEQGLVMGVNQSLAALGRIIGPAIGGYLYRDFSHGLPFITAGFLNGGALFFGALIYSKLPYAGKDGESNGDSGVGLMTVGGFQLFNIVRSDSPYIFIDMRGESEEAPPYLCEILARAVRSNPVEVVELVCEKAIDLSFPVILLCNDGHQSRAQGHILIEKGYINVFYVDGGMGNLKDFDPDE